MRATSSATVVRPRWMHSERDFRRYGQRYRIEIPKRIVRYGGVHDWVDDKIRRHDQDGVSVRWRLRSLPHADAAAGAADVLDVELLAQALGQFFRDDPRKDVVWSTRRERHDDADRPCRVGLRQRERVTRRRLPTRPHGAGIGVVGLSWCAALLVHTTSGLCEDKAVPSQTRVELWYPIDKLHIGADMVIELRHFRFFVAVAEEGHVTRAAERLGMQQPPLSQRIRFVEEELGAQLFLRRPRGVELTQAGRAFLEVARSMLRQYESAFEVTRRAARGQTGRLCVGATPTSAFHPIVSTAIRSFRDEFPDVNLTLEERLPAELIQGLQDEKLDVAFLRAETFKETGLLSDPCFPNR